MMPDVLEATISESRKHPVPAFHLSVPERTWSAPVLVAPPLSAATTSKTQVAVYSGKVPLHSCILVLIA